MGSLLISSSAPDARRRSGEAHSEMIAMSGFNRRSASSLRCSAMLQFQATRRMRSRLSGRCELDRRAEAVFGRDLEPIAHARRWNAVAPQLTLGRAEVL